MVLRPIKSTGAPFRRFMKMAKRSDARAPGGIERTVLKIIDRVRQDGDRALIELTRKFDGVRLSRRTLRVSVHEIEAARLGLPRAERRALELSARRIASFHRRTITKSFSYRDRLGVRLGQIVRPLRRVGIYVPGGLASYPSTVLMNAMAARVAGVDEVAMVSPPSARGGDGPVMAAAAIAGVSEFYRVGGAQAVAALAYGTESIRRVDKIVGPGNAYVQAAKRIVYGTVDIDKTAGPSEIVVIADDHARPDWVAADLIAQAEHGTGDELAVLLTDSRRLADNVAGQMEAALSSLPGARQVRNVLETRGAIVLTRGLDEAFDIANRIAPEHLELHLRRPTGGLKRIRSAGAVFLGGFSPAPLGDYIAGPNHVLPTGGSARFASPLGAYDFLARTSIIDAPAAALKALVPAAARLARMERFEGHARALELRTATERRPSNRKKKHERR